MKTIKEKAEEYDRLKALVMKCSINKYGCIIGIKPSDMFPELKESEDERIRKEIIEFIERNKKPNAPIPSDPYLDNWIAWIKKQGEQKPTELSNTCEFSMKTWVNIVDFVLTEHNGIGNYLDDPEVKDTAQKLQKKYKFDAASEEWDRVYRKGLDAGVNKGRAEALRELKPAWSEEDERAIDRACVALRAYSNGDLPVFLPSELLDYADRLQALLGKLPNVGSNVGSWKPSEEQIMYLSEAIEVVEKAEKYSIVTALKEILKQLKTL